jgi:hypothetical protein
MASDECFRRRSLSPFGRSVLIVLGVASLVAMAPRVYAARTPPASSRTTAAAPASSKTPPRAAPAKSTALPVTTPASAAAATPSVICFQHSVRCFTLLRAPGTPATTAPMDLHAPDVRKVFPIGELQKRLPEPEDERVAQEDTTVQVSSNRDLPPPTAPVGILAPFWALRHPTQAWRIFMPVPDAK